MDHRLDTSHIDQAIAWSVSLIGHIAILLYALSAVDTREHSKNRAVISDASTMRVEFVEYRSLKNAEQPVTAVKDFTEDSLDAPVSANDALPASMPLPENGDSARAEGSAGTSENVQMEPPVDAELTSSSQAVAESDADGELEMKYRSALQRAIMAHWTRPTDHQSGEPCVFTIHLSHDGIVRSAKSPPCAMDLENHRALEAAIFKAQPLPFAGYEGVFREEIQLQLGSSVLKSSLE